MATWFVRPNTSHSGTRDGTSYATAWGGYSEIVWGTILGVQGSDTLYVCGAHTYASFITVGAHGASAGNIATIRGDYAPGPGSIVFSGAAYFENTRPYTTVTNLPITGGTSLTLAIQAAATFGDYSFLTLNSGAGSCVYLAAGNGLTLTSVSLTDSTLNGLSTSGTVAISWLLSGAAAVGIVNGLNLSRNTFRGFTNSGTEGVVRIRSQPETSASTQLNNIIITENLIDTYTGYAIRVMHGTAVLAQGTNINVSRNTIRNGTTNAAGSGGAVGLWGFGGICLFEDNDIRNVTGIYGGLDIFYCRGLVAQRNYIDGMYTLTVDGNGVLLDIGNVGCVVRWNTFNNIVGKAAVDNSGCAVMVLDSTLCQVYGNVGNNIKTGFFFGVVGTGQSADVYNQTFTGVTDYGCHILSTASKANLNFKNNILSMTGGTGIHDTGSGWTNEDYNCVYGYATQSVNHTMGAGSIFTDPQLRADYSLPSTSPCKGTGTFVGFYQDFYGNEHNMPPDMGAVKYIDPPSLETDREIETRRRVIY